MIPDAAFADLVARLTPAPPPPVWSILVTLFGDLAQVPGTAIDGATLRALTAPMGLSPEAVRTALHRLRRDGWIGSRRAGRGSAHALTAKGRAESAAASPRIYARGQAAERAAMLLADPAAPLPDLPGCRLGPGLLLTPEGGGPDALALPVPPGTALPAWMATRLCPPDLRARAADLAAALADVRAQFDTLPPPAPLQAAILRVLVVHGWRRVVLRQPPLPDHVFPPDWQGARCRALAHDLLARLPVPDVASLA